MRIKSSMKKLEGILSEFVRGPQKPKPQPIGPASESWKNDPAIKADLKNQWFEKGFTVFPGLFSPEEVNQHNKIVRDCRQSLEETKDEFGFGDRIGQLHQQYPGLMNLSSKPELVKFIGWALDDKPLLFGSLNFDKGTQQELHIDSIFFYTEPVYSMVGAWVALEDVHPDAGPLFYVSGSHKWPFVSGYDVLLANKLSALKLRLTRDPARISSIIGKLGVRWTEKTLRIEKDRECMREPAILKAGDAVVWHALLAHGGSPRADISRSRKSVVYHFIGQNSRLFTFDQFFRLSPEQMKNNPGIPKTFGEYNGLNFMKFDVFTSYKDGREVLHPVQRG